MAAGVAEGECSLQNLTLCGDPPLTLDSLEAICDEGSLTIIFGILIFAAFFTIKQIIHHVTKQYEKTHTKQYEKTHTHGLYDTHIKEEDGSKKIVSHWVEEFICKPFIPASLEYLFVNLYFVWFIVTIPMAFTRYYDKIWAQVCFIQHCY